MIAKTPEERMRYEARLKAERDHHAQLLDAEQRGEARGEERGRKNSYVEEIRNFQALLKEPLTPSGRTCIAGPRGAARAPR
jgi:hypothetical protein